MISTPTHVSVSLCMNIYVHTYIYIHTYYIYMCKGTYLCMAKGRLERCLGHLVLEAPEVFGVWRIELRREQTEFGQKQVEST